MLPASRWANSVSAETTTIADAKVLRRIIINTGVANGTVIVTDTAGATIAVIDAAATSVGYQYDIVVHGLSVVTDDNALDVTVTFD